MSLSGGKFIALAVATAAAEYDIRTRQFSRDPRGVWPHVPRVSQKKRRRLERRAR